jgi:hypothetical protein
MQLQLGSLSTALPADTHLLIEVDHQQYSPVPILDKRRINRREITAVMMAARTSTTVQVQVLKNSKDFCSRALSSACWMMDHLT